MIELKDAGISPKSLKAAIAELEAAISRQSQMRESLEQILALQGGSSSGGRKPSAKKRPPSRRSGRRGRASKKPPKAALAEMRQTMTGKEIAEKLGVSVPSVTNWVNSYGLQKRKPSR